MQFIYSINSDLPPVIAMEVWKVRLVDVGVTVD